MAAVGENDQGANISYEVSRCGLRGSSDVSYGEFEHVVCFLKVELSPRGWGDGLDGKAFVLQV